MTQPSRYRGLPVSEGTAAGQLYPGDTPAGTLPATPEQVAGAFAAVARERSALAQQLREGGRGEEADIVAIGALIASALFFWRDARLSFWRTADVCGPAIALGQAIGRVGCFMAGDDYGRPSHVPWAVAFTDPDAARIGGAPLGIPLHPVQLYESMVCVVLFVVLLQLRRRRQFDGEMILAYTLLYAIARFVLEFFRGDADRGFVFGGLLSTSQFIAVLLGPVVTVLWVVRRQRTRVR